LNLHDLHALHSEACFLKLSASAALREKQEEIRAETQGRREELLRLAKRGGAAAGTNITMKIICSSFMIFMPFMVNILSETQRLCVFVRHVESGTQESGNREFAQGRGMAVSLEPRANRRTW